MHAMSGAGDITKMGGLRKQLPWTHGVFFVCCLAIAGVPPFSGFFSKDAILVGRLRPPTIYGERPGLGRHAGRAPMLLAGRAGHRVLHVAPLLPGLLRATCRADAARHEHHIHESPREMIGAAGASWRSAPRWAASSACPGACSATPSGTCSAHWLEPVAAGAEVHIAHALEIGFMVGVDRRSAWSASAWPTCFYGGGYREPAAQVRRRRVPGFVQAGAGQVPRRRALRRCSSSARIRALSRGAVPASSTASSSTRSWSSGLAAVVDVARAHRPQLPERRRAALPGGVRRRRRGAGLPGDAGRTVARRPEGDRRAARRRRRRRPGAATRRPARSTTSSTSTTTARAEVAKAHVRDGQARLRAAAASYTRSVVKRARSALGHQRPPLKQKVTVQVDGPPRPGSRCCRCSAPCW